MMTSTWYAPAFRSTGADDEAQCARRRASIRRAITHIVHYKGKEKAECKQTVSKRAKNATATTKATKEHVSYARKR